MKLVILLSCAGLTAAAHANGGGFFRGGVDRAGDVEVFAPQEVEKVRILDEKLTVEFGKEEASVEVRYLMRNETASKVTVRFGFPVEELVDRGFNEPGPEKGSANRGPKYCRDYEITAGGKKVAAKWQGEETADEDERVKGIAGWLVSELTFTAGEEKPVMIRFKSGYPLEQWSVSEDGHTSARVFKYRLSTAACWAGTIGSGSIVLKPAGIVPGELKVLKPVNRFKKDGDSWVWNFEDLEPTLADDLEIEVSPEIESYGRPLTEDLEGSGPWVNYVQRGGQWTMAHNNFVVKASSTLLPDGQITYRADHVKELWKDSAWSEGAAGLGIGEWLLLEPVVAKPLTAITLRPGYAKSDELFKANARPKKILVELNGEHRFHAEVADENAAQDIAVTGYTKPVKTVKIGIEEVWPGSRYEDLCISSILLHARLDKKPEIQPSR